MKHKIVATLILALAYTMVVYATPQFRTERLARMAKAMSLEIPDILPANMDNDSTWSYGGHRLRVKTNAFGDVSNIGYRMFDSKSDFYFHRFFLFDFVERYALELDLHLDKHDAALRMSIDNVVCVEGNVGMLAKVTPETPVSMDEITLRMFRMVWTVGGKTLKMTFPLDNQLIVGANDAELEDVFERDVKRVMPISEEDALDEWKDAKIYRSDSLLIAEMGQHLNPMIRGDIYLEEHNGKRSVVNDANKPLQTTKNVLLTGVFSHDIPLKLTTDRYGYRETTIDITVQQLVALCRLEGCQLYVGIKTSDKEHITATVFALNSGMAYSHVISVDFPLDILQGSDSAAKATVYAYIPLHNVGENFYKRLLSK